MPGADVSFYSLGEGAVTVSAGPGAMADRNARMRAFAQAVRERPFPGFIEAAAAIHTATVYYDAWRLYRGLDLLAQDGLAAADPEPDSLQEVVIRALKRIWNGLEPAEEQQSRLVNIPVAYGGQWGPDLEAAAKLCGISAEQLIGLHSGAEYRVLMIGFVPGFPYLEGLPDALKVDRLPAPRLKVPAGSVALGGGQTGIYPLETPGGWRLIGRTPLPLFRPEGEEPSLLRAGDRVRFIPVEEFSLGGGLS